MDTAIVMQIVIGVIIAAVTGSVSAWKTMHGLQIHISYINELLKKHDDAITRAHARLDEQTRRIDDIDRRVFHIEQINSKG